MILLLTPFTETPLCVSTRVGCHEGAHINTALSTKDWKQLPFTRALSCYNVFTISGIAPSIQTMRHKVSSKTAIHLKSNIQTTCTTFVFKKKKQSVGGGRIGEGEKRGREHRYMLAKTHISSSGRTHPHTCAHTHSHTYKYTQAGVTLSPLYMLFYRLSILTWKHKFQNVPKLTAF